MRFIPTFIHGLLDYLTGILLCASPWLLGFAHGGSETDLPVVLGFAALVYSSITRYELGLLRIIGMRMHLVLDFCSGVLLASSPWLFGFKDVVYLPHLLVGGFEIFAALTTIPTPGVRAGHLTANPVTLA